MKKPKGYSILKSALGWTWTFLEGTCHHNSIMLTPPYLRILNSILHLEPPCATPSSHILNYLIPPSPTLRIIFRSPPPGNLWKWNSPNLKVMHENEWIKGGEPSIIVNISRQVIHIWKQTCDGPPFKMCKHQHFTRLKWWVYRFQICFHWSPLQNMFCILIKC